MSNDATVRTDAGDMPAHVFLPPSGGGPGLLLVQEIFGVSRYIRSRAEDLAALGYVVLVPELFWRVGVSAVAEGPDALQEAMEVTGRVDWDTAVADGVRALVTLRERPEVTDGAGVIGFCYGGGLAFAIAAHEPADCLVSYYGSALPGLLDLAPRVTTSSLHHFGRDDAYIDQPSQQRIQAAVTAHGARFETYAGAGHAFDNPDFTAGYNREASAQAWSRTVAFLAENLPLGATSSA